MTQIPENNFGLLKRVARGIGIANGTVRPLVQVTLLQLILIVPSNRDASKDRP